MCKKLYELLEAGCQGEVIPTAQIITELDRFSVIILRGAGAFGSALGKWLISFEQLVPKLVYRDQKANELDMVNGIKVELPHSIQYDVEKTLAVHCIPGGGTIGSHITAELKRSNYTHVIDGMDLFETAVCQLDKQTGFKAKACLDTTACTWCNCKLLMNLLKQSPSCNRSRFTNDLAPQIQTFIITTRCSLKCKHCSYLLNYYPKGGLKDVEVSRVIEDVDRFFAAVDTVGFVSLIGGEAFLHPEFNKIVEHILTKQNFGMLGVTTNGVCTITDENLRVLKNDRTRLIFSHYAHALNEKQEAVFQANVEKVRRAGIYYTIGEPMWDTPAPLVWRDITEEELRPQRATCVGSFVSKIILDGKYFPCSICMNVDGLKVAETQDFVDLSQSGSAEKLRNDIIALTQMPAYQSCRYCWDSGVPLPYSGEQGTDLRYKHLLKKNDFNNIQF